MGTTVFETKDSVFIVGGLGTKAGASYPGGCTLEAWNDPAKINKDLTKMMGANGEELVLLSPVTAINSTGGNSGLTDYVRIWGDFSNCEPGLLAYFSSNGTYVTGSYEVLYADDEEIVINLAYISDEANDWINVGGAFQTAQNAWTNTDAAQGYNVTIYSNKNQSKTDGNFTATWSLGTAGGSISNKSFKRFVGFTTQPEDGGQIAFDGEDDAAFSIGGIYFNDTIESVIFENVIVEDTNLNWRVSFSTSCVRFKNCEGNSGSAAGWVLGYGRGFSLISCKAKNNGGYGFSVGYSSGVPDHCLINCIASGNTKDGFYRIGGYSGSVAIGCVAYGNGKGATKYNGFSVRSRYGFGVVINCIAYDNGKHGFEFLYRNPVAINCIAQSNGQKGFYADTAAAELMAPHVAYCNSYDNGGGNYDLPDALPPVNCIEKDSLFVDAASGDFRPRNPAVLRGGRPDINGNPTQMGAILQKYQFGDRERIANMARLRIVR